jgi:hypothetical protein
MVGRCDSGGGAGSGAIGGSAMASTPRFGSFYSGRKEDELDCSSLYELTKPHVESYDYFVERGLEEAVRRLQPVELKHPISGATLRYILSVHFLLPFAWNSLARSRLSAPHSCCAQLFNVTSSVFDHGFVMFHFYILISEGFGKDDCSIEHC